MKIYSKNWTMTFSGDNLEWLGMFKKLHRLDTLDDALTELINTYKAWNKLLDKNSEGSIEDDE